MNHILLYDKTRAAQELERQAGLRNQSPHVVCSAALLTDDEDWANVYKTLQYGPTWRLVHLAADGEPEEAVISFQGVIEKADLAPFVLKPFHEKHNAGRFLRQSLTLNGLNTPTFKKVVNAMVEIHALMARAVGQDDMQECGMIATNDDDEVVLNMSNRYLTPKKEAGMSPACSIPHVVDPKGNLGRIAGQNYIYTEDNNVRFYERRKIPGTDDHRFDECDPIIFRAGDVVEVQVTFIIVAGREGRKKTLMVLRSLSLLDGTITQKSMIAQLSRREDPKVERTLKRRVGYEEEDLLSAEAKRKEEGTTRPFLKRRTGYHQEVVSETTQRLTEMEIDTGAAGRGEANDMD